LIIVNDLVNVKRIKKTSSALALLVPCRMPFLSRKSGLRVLPNAKISRLHGRRGHPSTAGEAAPRRGGCPSPGRLPAPSAQKVYSLEEVY